MITKKKTAIKNKLESMGLPMDACQMILEAVEIIDEHGIHPLDVVLKTDVYPYLAKRNKLNASTVEKKLIKYLSECWCCLESRKKVVKALNYESKPTTKKLIQLLLIK